VQGGQRILPPPWRVSPAACNRAITSDQHDPSANSPVHEDDRCAPGRNGTGGGPAFGPGSGQRRRRPTGRSKNYVGSIIMIHLR